VLLAIGLLAGQAQAMDAHAQVQVLADASTVEAGRPFALAVVLTPDPGWHVYWKNPGESGLPTKIHVEAPAGFVVGDMAYPLPERIVVPGNIVNYGYPAETVFLLPVTPPKTLTDGATVALTVKVSWLCCKDECMPGRASLPLSLPVGKAAAANEAVFAQARATMPANAPPPNLVTVAPDTPAAAVGLHLDWKQDVTDVTLYPTSIDGLEVSAINAETTGRNTHIALTARIMAGQKLPTEDLPVLIVYQNKDGQRRGFYTSVNLHALLPTKP
jgi:thiol:disulfide interchange protein DsbD